MKISPHFTLEELTASETAARRGIDNTAPDVIVDHLGQLATGLERIRNILGAPILVSSGYRCLALNRAIGSKDSSAHVQGYAADFICPGFGIPLEVVKRISASAIDFDQCIHEGGRWVHISFAPPLRREVLTAHFGLGGTTYTKGALT
jgi:hypothetical protein